MTVLVAYASKHGATREIAEALGRDLRSRGIDVDVFRADEVGGLDEYDAVVLGSAVYMGNWLPAAQALRDRCTHEHLWLFSSGPIGDPPLPAPPDVGPRHRIIPGKIDRQGLSLAERGIVKLVKAAYGDYRDWDAVAELADDVADELGVSAYSIA
ncbi:MAG: flavodoxin domain-containing protein [Actinomycetota bacterium]